MYKLKLRETLIVIASLSVIFSASGQSMTRLPRSIPEMEGVSSSGILRFVEAAEKSKNELHSFMFLRHGKVIAEGWWDPYKPDLRQSLYSTSKTFTSAAVGLAINETLLKLSDKVISFFPNDRPDSISAFLAALTVGDLITMTEGQDPDPTPVVNTSKNWVRAFFTTPIDNKPGTVFLYNSLGVYVLSAIVQRVTGEKVLDYLKTRLFDPLGITGMDWEENLMSVNTGGWGLRIKTEDMAKFGQLYLQKGLWNGNQLIPASWIEESSTAKIIQHPGLAQSKKDSSDWEQGYGYLIWRCRHNGYRADGAFGQFIIVLPEQDAVIAIQAETSNMQNELNLVWDYLLPSIKKTKLPEDRGSQNALKEKLTSLSIKPAVGSFSVLAANRSMDKYFIMDPNSAQFESISLHIKDTICQMIINAGRDTYNLYYGAGHWKKTQTNKPGPYAVSEAKENWALLSPYKVASNFYWKDEKTLVMEMRYIESPHTETTTCHFEGSTITVDIERSFDYGSKRTTMIGVLK